MQKLEAALADKQKVEAVAQSAVDVKKEGLKAENKKKKELTKNIQDVGFFILNPNEVFRLNRIKQFWRMLLFEENKLNISFELQNKKALVSKEKDMSKLGQELEKLQAQSTTDQANHDSAQKHYQAVSAGLSSNTDGEAASLNDQLMSKYTH